MKTIDDYITTAQSKIILSTLSDVGFEDYHELEEVYDINFTSFNDAASHVIKDGFLTAQSYGLDLTPTIWRFGFKLAVNDKISRSQACKIADLEAKVRYLEK